MFASLFRKAQATVDNAVSQVVNRLIVVVPFVVALGFATAAAFAWLSESYGTQMASLLLACGYAAIGGVLALSIYPTSADEEATSVVSTTEDAPASRSDEASSDGLDNLDHELLMKTLASAAPIAVPLILRNVVRHLPILMAVASAAYVLSRTDIGSKETQSTGLQAAE